MTSEIDPDAKLPLPHVRKGRDAKNLTRSSRIDGRIRLTEVDMIKGIEELGTELPFDRFGDSEALTQRCIEVEESRPKE
jgi:hypothetical protein